MATQATKKAVVRRAKIGKQALKTLRNGAVGDWLVGEVRDRLVNRGMTAEQVAAVDLDAHDIDDAIAERFDEVAEEYYGEATAITPATRKTLEDLLKKANGGISTVRDLDGDPADYIVLSEVPATYLTDRVSHSPDAIWAVECDGIRSYAIDDCDGWRMGDLDDVDNIEAIWNDVAEEARSQPECVAMLDLFPDVSGEIDDAINGEGDWSRGGLRGTSCPAYAKTAIIDRIDDIMTIVRDNVRAYEPPTDTDQDAAYTPEQIEWANG